MRKQTRATGQSERLPSGMPGTFSIAGRDTDRGAFGVAISTAMVGVGATCPHVSANGAVSIQSFGRAEHGELAIEMVDRGLSLPSAISAILEDDQHASYRQWHGIDAEGRTTTFTGEDCVDWCGALDEDDHTVAGNMLANGDVIEAMSATFSSTEGPLSERLVSALESGQAAGGDKRGKISAALLVHSPDSKPYHNLRIDNAEDPIESLRETYELAVDTDERLADDVSEMLGDYPEQILNFGIKY